MRLDGGFDRHLVGVEFEVAGAFVDHRVAVVVTAQVNKSRAPLSAQRYNVVDVKSQFNALANLTNPLACGITFSTFLRLLLTLGLTSINAL